MKSTRKSREDDWPMSTQCNVKQRFADDWTELFPGKHNTSHSLLKLCTDLKKMPHLKFKCLDGLLKVIKRLAPEEARINYSEKMDLST